MRCCLCFISDQAKLVSCAAFRLRTFIVSGKRSLRDFQEALAALLGKDAPNLSPAVLTRLKAGWQEEFDRWKRRDLSARRYVYIWADGVYLQGRMEPEANVYLRRLSQPESAESDKRSFGFCAPSIAAVASRRILPQAPSRSQARHRRWRVPAGRRGRGLSNPPGVRARIGRFPDSQTETQSALFCPPAWHRSGQECIA